MNSSGEALQVGVIGLGMQGQKHLRNLGACHRARLTAVCDIDEDRLTSSAECYGVPQRFTDYADLIRSPDVQAVVVALPDHMHREPAVAALSAGKHLLLEKPMAVTLEDAEAIERAARSANVCAMLNMSNRWMYPFARGKELLESGEMGDVRYIFARLANRITVPTQMLPWLRNSHPAHWIGVHRLDIARWWIGSEVSRVRGVHRYGVLRDSGYDAPDFFQATLEFSSGAVMSLEVNWILPPSYPGLVDSKFYALCSKGVIDVDRLRSELNVAKSDAVETATPTDGPSLGQLSGYTFAAARHFVDSALDGTPPLVGMEDGLKLARTLCAIVDSCTNDGQVIELSG